jgi:hypothetical protein
MVAEAEPKTSSRPKKPNGRGHAPEIDLATRSQARNLYAVRRLGGEEVAKRTGLSVRQIQSLAHREGWTDLRRKLKERELRLSQEREEQDVKEMVAAVAIKNKVLTLGTLDEAIDELAHGGEFKAKNLQALSVAAKNFNGMWREAKALDQLDAQANGSTLNVMFVGSLPRSSERTTVNVTPAQSVIDVAPAAGSAGSGTQ